MMQCWFRWWLGTEQVTSHYLNQWWSVCWRIYATLGLSELKLIVAYWRHMATEIWVNIGSSNGLLPDGTNPLPEPMLTDHQWSPHFILTATFLQPVPSSKAGLQTCKLYQLRSRGFNAFWSFILESKGKENTYRAESRFVPSQWETALYCNDISH